LELTKQDVNKLCYLPSKSLVFPISLLSFFNYYTGSCVAQKSG